MACKVVMQEAATSSGDQTITGAGFTPKAVIALCNRMTADGYQAGISFSWGMATGASNQVAYNMFSEDNAGTSNTGRNRDASNFIRITDSTGGDIDLASFKEFNSDGCVITWNASNVPGSAWDIVYMFFGGDDLTDATVGNFTTNTATGNQTISSVGLDPDDVLFVHSDHGVTGAGFSLGFMSDKSGGLLQWGAQCIAADTGDTMAATYESGGNYDTATCIRMSNVPMGGDTYAAAAVSLGTDQFIVNLTTAPSTGRVVDYLALQYGASGDSYAGVVAKSSSATDPNDQTVSSQPAAMEGFLFVQADRAFDTGNSSDSCFSIGVAGGTGTTDQYVFSIFNNSVINTESDQSLESNRVIKHFAQPSTDNYEARLKTINATDFVIEHSPVEASTDSFAYWTFLGGDEAATDPLPTDGIELSEQVTVTIGIARSRIDGIDLSEDVSEQAVYSRAFTDGIDLSEDVTRTLAGLISRPRTDGIDLSESVQITIDYARVETEVIQLSESIEVATTYSKTATDGIDLSEDVTRTLLVDIRRPQTDGIELSELTTVTVKTVLLASDGIDLSEAVSLSIVGGREPTDAVLMSEDLTAATVYDRVLSPDGIQLSDSTTRTLDDGFYLGVNEFYPKHLKLRRAFT